VEENERPQRFGGGEGRQVLRAVKTRAVVRLETVGVRGTDVSIYAGKIPAWGRGIRTVVGVTRSAHKQRLGQQFGALVVVSAAHAEQACTDLTDRRGVDFAIEAAGTAATFAQAVRLTALGGTVVLFGTMGKNADTARLPFYDLYYKELTVRNPRGAMADALDAAADSSQLKVTLDLTA
jgi:threonine dehydrogenase-like Zn-dependent dehydrogenase